MKSEHEEYILKNIDKLSVKKISQDLNLKEKKIWEFLEYQKNMEKQPGTPSQKNETPGKFPRIFLSIALLIVLGFAVYSNSLNSEFIWDDRSLVETNEYIRDWSYLSNTFIKGIGGAEDKTRFYRPFQMATYMIDYSLWGLNPIGYHLTNLFIHICVSLSVYWLINIISKNDFLSLMTGVFFVVHPIHTEAITYISGRADPLAVLFMLLCFIFYIKSPPSRRMGAYILILLSYLLALLSKESSLILPALILLYHYSFKNKLKVKEFLAIICIASIYILFRATVLKVSLMNVVYPTTLPERLPGFFVAVATYIKLLFLPFNLHMEYGSTIFHWENPKAIAGAVLLFVLLISAFKKKDEHRLVFFSILWFFISLFPVSNLYPINAYMAEHWMYLPSVGFFLIVAHAISALYRAKDFRIFIAIFVISLLAFYSFLTIRQNSFWREPISFYERTLKYAPDSSRTYNNLGNVYANIGKTEAAIISYKKAIEIKFDYADAHYNLCKAYNDVGKNKEAIISCKKTIEIKADHIGAYNNLGTAYAAIDKNEEAIISYKKAIEIKADHATAHYNLGNAYSVMGRKEEAIASYKKAIGIKVNFSNAHNNLGNVYSALNKDEEAIAEYKKAIKINPDYAEAYYNLGNIYNKRGEKEKAIALYKKTLKINPTISRVYDNLGEEYYAMGKIEESIISYKKAIEINPDHAIAYGNLAVIYFDQKQYDLAIKSFDKATELGYSNPPFYEKLKPYR